MDSILQAFLNDTDALLGRRVEQIVAICGNGSLSDGSSCSQEFREFLKNVPSRILKKYSEECLDGTLGRRQNSGLILQDVVNEVGDRLGYSVAPGYYRGSPSRIGHDGLWLSDDFSFVIEVKTSDLSIKLDTIAGYRDRLISASKIKGDKSSILIVIGRQDTGDLEAQIRGSRHAWDIRMVGVNALFRLVELRENLTDPNSITQITELFKPIEYTRVDQLIDVVFLASSDIATPDIPEPQENEALPIATGERPEVVETESGVKRRTHSSPVKFYEECLARINQKLDKTLIRNGRVTYTSSDKSINLVLLNSKSYSDPSGRSFWYGFRPNQAEFLKKKQDSYIGFGCGNEDLIILIPFRVFEPWTAEMRVSWGEDGVVVHQHVVIVESDSQYLLRVGDDHQDLTEFVLEAPRQVNEGRV